MYVRLTHRGKPTIFNAKQVVTMYMDTDLKSGEFKCKVITTNGSVFVDEALNVAHEKLNMAILGEFTTDYEYDIPSIDDRVESRYNHETAPNHFNMGNTQSRPRQRSYRQPYYERERY